jgi:hypothetical protein
VPEPARNPAIEKLVRWVIAKAVMVMTDATRWEMLVQGKGDKYTCKISVYEDP